VVPFDSYLLSYGASTLQSKSTASKSRPRLLVLVAGDVLSSSTSTLVWTWRDFIPSNRPIEHAIYCWKFCRTSRSIILFYYLLNENKTSFHPSRWSARNLVS